MDSPNMARKGNQQELKGFMNSGYYELYLENKIEEKQKTEVVLLDRNSRLFDLEALVLLFQKITFVKKI
jgi:hypothetical protein